MTAWLLAQREIIGLVGLGFLAGVVFASWRQGRLEDARWERDLRSELVERIRFYTVK